MSLAALDQQSARALRDAGAIALEDIIGAGDIQQLAGVGRVTLKHWRDGRNLRGAGPFPQPFRTVSGTPLYDRREVLAWLEQHKP